jgi:hypothetical protein
VTFRGHGRRANDRRRRAYGLLLPLKRCLAAGSDQRKLLVKLTKLYKSGTYGRLALAF